MNGTASMVWFVASLILHFATKSNYRIFPQKDHFKPLDHTRLKQPNKHLREFDDNSSTPTERLQASHHLLNEHKESSLQPQLFKRMKTISTTKTESAGSTVFI